MGIGRGARKQAWLPLDEKEREKRLSQLPETFRALFRIQDRDQKRVIPFELNACQKGLHNLIVRIRAFNKYRTQRARLEDPGAPAYEGVRVVIGKCRRGGVSTYVQARAAVGCFFRDNFRVLTMAHKGTNAEEIYRYSRQFYNWWPPEHESLRPPFVLNNQSRFELVNGSRIITETTGGSNVTRGFEYDLYHFSEPAHYDDYSEVNAAVLAAPRHASIFEESTANGIGGGFYNRWRGAMEIEDVEQALKAADWETLHRWERAGGFIRYFFSWLDDKEYRSFVFEDEKPSIRASLTDYERNLMVAHRATLEQIKWRRNKMGSASDENQTGLSDEQWILQEFPTTADEMFQATGNTVFDQVLLAGIDLRASAHRRAHPPMYLKVSHDDPPALAPPGGSNLVIYEMPVRGALYAAGGDIGGGIGKDDSVLVMLDRGDGTHAREVACMRSNTIGAQHWGDLCTWLGELYNGAFLNPEANGPGLETCGRIVANRYPWIYHRRALDAVSENDPTNSFRFGFNTNGNSKGVAIEKLRAAVKDGSIELRSAWLIDQLRMFAKKPTGGFGAPSGEKDDGVIAVALGWFAHIAPGVAPPVGSREMRLRQDAQLSSAVDEFSRAVWAALEQAEPRLTRAVRLRAAAFGFVAR